MTGNPLYNLHPIFEFTLTACFTMLIAPKFLDDIFGDFIPYSFKSKTEKMLKGFRKEHKIAKHRLANFTRLGLGDGSQKDNILNLGQLIAELENAIGNFKMPDYSTEEKNFINYINYLYRMILPLGCIYSLIILLVNGCDPVNHKLEVFFYELSIFNILIFLFFVFLRYRDKLHFGIIRVVNIRAMLIVLILILISSFKVVPYINLNKTVCNCKLLYDCSVADCTIIGTLLVAFCPIVFYILDVYFFQSSMDNIIKNKEENQDLLVKSANVSILIQDIAQQIDREVSSSGE